DTKCVTCHNPNGKEKDILLDSESNILNGKVDDLPMVVPGKASESPLYLVLLEDEALRGELEKMPPEKAVGKNPNLAVTRQEIDVVAAWINGIAKSDTPNDSDNSSEQPDENQEPPVVNLPITDKPEIPPVANQPEEPPTDVPNSQIIDFNYVKTQIIDKKCIKCHQPGGKEEDIPFETRDEVLSGSNDVGESILVPGKPEESLFYLSLLPDKPSRKGAAKMPSPKAVKKGDVEDITASEIELIKQWITEGAK
ncbi:MAG: hypothetical protein KDD45_11970, partial [Bdellovibrionales bacterium]|nr:hypothetical protein [Bdellovibrionales bacterium]